MRVLIISDAVHPFNKGGKETRLKELTHRLADEVSFLIFTMKWWDEPGEHVDQHGIRHIAVSKNIPLYSSENVRSIYQAVYFACVLFWPLIKHRKEYDVIDADQIPYFQLFTVRFVNFFLGKKFVCTWHEVFGKKYWKKYLGSFKGSIAFVIEKLAARMPQKIIAASEHAAKDLVEHLGVGQEKIEVVSNGVDVSQIQSVQPASKQYDLIFIGRLLAHKNVALALEALHLLKSTASLEPSFAVIGDGPEMDPLKKYAQEKQLNNVDFLGFVEDHNEMISYLKASKALLFLSEREGFGLVVLEAYAASLPVIALDAPKNGARVFVNDCTGALVSKKPQVVADAIMRVLNSGKSQYSEAVAEKVKDYDWQRSAAQLKKLYSS